jgi:hypothetical protein
MMRRVEEEAIAGGVPSSKARHATDALSGQLLQVLAGQGRFKMGMRTGFKHERLRPGSKAVELFPLAMYKVIVREARRGRGRARISRALLAAYTNGQLRGGERR